MRKRPPSEGRPLRALLCSIFGHQYRVSREITGHIKEFACTHCERQLTTDAEGKISELTYEKQRINETLMAMHRRRRMRVDSQNRKAS